MAKNHLEGKGNVENFLTAENCVKVELVTRLVVTSTDKLQCGNMWCSSSPRAPELSLSLLIHELTLSPLERSLRKETFKAGKCPADLLNSGPCNEFLEILVRPEIKKFCD